jgi:hypothetical protein
VLAYHRYVRGIQWLAYVLPGRYRLLMSSFSVAIGYAVAGPSTIVANESLVSGMPLTRIYIPISNSNGKYGRKKKSDVLRLINEAASQPTLSPAGHVIG